MAGIALLIELISKNKNPSFKTQALQSCRSISATLAASAAAASVASPLLSRSSFGFGRRVAYCDAGAALSEDALIAIQSPPGSIFEHDQYQCSSKEYYIKLKPLLSAFHWKTFTLVTLRAFLLHFLPLVEPRAAIDEDDDDDFLRNAADPQDVDLVVPFKKSIKQIIRETTVVTTRRILERLAVCYVSQRTAWKLIKDVSISATRKAGRDLPITVYIFRVSRTTFRGHFLGVTATWLVQVAIDIYRFLSSIFRTDEEADPINKVEQVQRLQKKVVTVTLKCGASLIFASIGAGIGATIMRPSLGQLIGCVLGDLAGPSIVSYLFDLAIRQVRTSP
ncbi:uncharacterized protein LOC141698579 [Apium graveolens]|uniref:uncharacterized protein LOC141698579 n=1 Tax=Apium graveolens TaxID=4045 RepID=UPI003D7A38BA